jgi:hypothetical protein
VLIPAGRRVVFTRSNDFYLPSLRLEGGGSAPCGYSPASFYCTVQLQSECLNGLHKAELVTPTCSWRQYWSQDGGVEEAPAGSLEVPLQVTQLTRSFLVQLVRRERGARGVRTAAPACTPPPATPCRGSAPAAQAGGATGATSSAMLSGTWKRNFG